MAALPSTKKPSKSTFWIEYNTVVSASPYNRKEERIRLPGARWRGKFEYPPLTRAQFDEIMAFLAGLTGSFTTFQAHDFTKETPRGTAVGSGQVKGAGQTGYALVTDTWTASQTGLFLPGDFIGFQGEMHMVTATAAADGSGESTIAIAPAIRVSPTDNEVIVKASVPITVRLIDDSQAAYQVSADTANRYNITLEFAEAY